MKAVNEPHFPQLRPCIDPSSLVWTGALICLDPPPAVEVTLCQAWASTLRSPGGFCLSALGKPAKSPTHLGLPCCEKPNPPHREVTWRNRGLGYSLQSIQPKASTNLPFMQSHGPAMVPPAQSGPVNALPELHVHEQINKTVVELSYYIWGIICFSTIDDQNNDR